MKESNTKPTIQFQLKRTVPTVKILLAVLIVLSCSALLAVHWVHSGIQAETEKLRQEAARVEFANEKLSQRNQTPDSIDNIRQIAQEQLGLVDPRAIAIEPNS